MDERDDSGEWSCPGCGMPAVAAFCPGCGEARPARKDLTLRGFLVEAFHVVTDVDGRLLRSFRALLLRPGELTVAYREGRRKSFLGPLQIFLIANVLFFALEGLSGDHIFSTSLASHLSTQDWKALAQSLVTERLRELDTTLEAYSTSFDLAASRNAKSLVILMTLPFMLVLPLFHPGRARGIVVRAAFALHLYAFSLLMFCVALLFADVQIALGGDGLLSPRVDTWMTILLLCGYIAYLYTALARVYPAPRWLLAIRALSLGIVVAAIVPGYRFVIFLITLYTAR